MNKTVYLLEVLVWQKGKDAQKKAPLHRPQPFVPDFMKAVAGKKKDIRRGIEAHTVDDIRNILAKPRV